MVDLQVSFRMDVIAGPLVPSICRDDFRATAQESPFDANLGPVNGRFGPVGEWSGADDGIVG
jgi:hypothetical protein